MRFDSIFLFSLRWRRWRWRRRRRRRRRRFYNGRALHCPILLFNYFILLSFWFNYSIFSCDSFVDGILCGGRYWKICLKICGGLWRDFMGYFGDSWRILRIFRGFFGISHGSHGILEGFFEDSEHSAVFFHFKMGFLWIFWDFLWILRINKLI